MDEERAIMNKILSAGKPMSEWTVKVHRGMGAGYRKTFVVDDASDDAKYVCAALNSELARWFALRAPKAACSKISGIEDMPIPQIGADEMQEVIALVDEIVAAKADDPNADTWHKEFELNDLIYDLYDITGEEEGAIMRALGLEQDVDESNAVDEMTTTSGACKNDFVSEEEIMGILRAADAS